MASVYVPIGSRHEPLCLQLVLLFGDVMEPLGHGPCLVEVDCWWYTLKVIFESYFPVVLSAS